MIEFLKRNFSVLLATVMILSVVMSCAIGLTINASAKTIEDYKVGDIIEFGSYPQSVVTSSSIRSALGKISKTWKSYGYYSGTGDQSDGRMTPSDFMRYVDIEYNGNKYRAVTFSHYRVPDTGDNYMDPDIINYQYYNGYDPAMIYYFKYEPIKWRVLDPSEGFVMSEMCVDSQAFQNFVYFYDTNKNWKYDYDEFYNSLNCKNSASDWATSSLRAWLNNDFYDTAFSSAEKEKIGTSLLKNKSVYSSHYDGADTYDKIFILSWWDATNSKYGFNTSDANYDSKRMKKATDYAKCQGCFTVGNKNLDNYGYSGWLLRSPEYSFCITNVTSFGDVRSDVNNATINNTYNGICPAFKFNLKSTIFTCSEHKYESTITKEPTCTTDGEKKFVCSVCEESYTEKISKLGHNFGEWKLTQESSIESTGIETRYCSRCSEVETRDVPKLSTVSAEMQKSIELKYKATDKFNPQISNPNNYGYTLSYQSSNPSVVTVDKDGNVVATGRGTATITCTVKDETGAVYKDTSDVTVKFSFGQWLIWIFLLGFLWY